MLFGSTAMSLMNMREGWLLNHRGSPQICATTYALNILSSPRSQFMAIPETPDACKKFDRQMRLPNAAVSFGSAKVNSWQCGGMGDYNILCSLERLNGKLEHQRDIAPAKCK